MASNFVGKGQTGTCERWDKKKKEYIKVERPEAIKMYNSYMGGVDKMDQLLSFYRSYVRSRKWTLRMITHAVDLALGNSWIEYRNKAESLGITKRKSMDLLSFRQSIGEKLILFRSAPKRGRPSAGDEEQPGCSTPKRKKKRYRLIQIKYSTDTITYHNATTRKKTPGAKCQDAN